MSSHFTKTIPVTPRQNSFCSQLHTNCFFNIIEQIILSRMKRECEESIGLRMNSSDTKWAPPRADLKTVKLIFLKKKTWIITLTYNVSIVSKLMNNIVAGFLQLERWKIRVNPPQYHKPIRFTIN